MYHVKSVEDLGHGHDALDGEVRTVVHQVALLAADLLVERLLPLRCLVVLNLTDNTTHASLSSTQHMPRCPQPDRQHNTCLVVLNTTHASLSSTWQTTQHMPRCRQPDRQHNTSWQHASTYWATLSKFSFSSLKAHSENIISHKLEDWIKFSHLNCLLSTRRP